MKVHQPHQARHLQMPNLTANMAFCMNAAVTPCSGQRHAAMHECNVPQPLRHSPTTSSSSDASLRTKFQPSWSLWMIEWTDLQGKVNNSIKDPMQIHCSQDWSCRVEASSHSLAATLGSRQS